MTDATYWIFFGLMPATVMLMAWAAVRYNRWSLEADERKSRAEAASKAQAGAGKPPA